MLSGNTAYMDRTNEFRAIVRRVFAKVARMMASVEGLNTELICDESKGHYQLGQVGWDGRRRIDDIYLHVDVYDDRVWIQHDGTDLPIAEAIAREGRPKSSIVLAFYPPELRQYTDYAAA